jgi:L-asparagine transporter-like permease
MERLIALLAVAGAAVGVGVMAGDAGLSDRSSAVIALVALVIGVVVVMVTPGWGRSIDRSREKARV